MMSFHAQRRPRIVSESTSVQSMGTEPDRRPMTLSRFSMLLLVTLCLFHDSHARLVEIDSGGNGGRPATHYSVDAHANYSFLQKILEAAGGGDTSVMSVLIRA